MYVERVGVVVDLDNLASQRTAEKAGLHERESSGVTYGPLGGEGWTSGPSRGSLRTENEPPLTSDIMSGWLSSHAVEPFADVTARSEDRT